MPQHLRKASAKVGIFNELAKEKTKKHVLFLSFSSFSVILHPISKRIENFSY